MVEIKPASQVEALKYYKRNPPFSFRGYVGLEGDNILGLGGIYRYGGRLWAFCDISDVGRTKRLSIMKVAKKVLALAEGRTVYAVAGNNTTAPSFLAHLGFELIDEENSLYRRLM